MDAFQRWRHLIFSNKLCLDFDSLVTLTEQFPLEDLFHALNALSDKLYILFLSTQTKKLNIKVSSINKGTKL